MTHTFAVCAYQESPYLEACIRSLKRQTVRSNIIICTSTPCDHIAGIAEKYKLPLYVRDGESDIQDDWNFALAMADSRLVTIAHQDDCYHKEYARYVQQCWEKYPDTTVFMTDCVIVKGNIVRKSNLVLMIKRLLRIPLRFHGFADRIRVKKAVLSLGNPVICPSCTYDKEEIGLPIFQSPYKFALDWDTMWSLASRKGRFYCEELPLLRYRVHDDSETKKCIGDNRRGLDEVAMFCKIWPKPMAKLLMVFYKKAWKAYD